ncbi:tyrosine-type recombinase/integrase [Mesorhizobium sp. DCY119]|uniref:tyrosine-type recombinase/integrase n=1 Tax=Mesorhizobium sp. DCY119 TaxID=2108445 RepID=UPI000E6CAD75|nr:tyrosine-type recombinase/integrase [Mesorhizobium sp. DCY119]RJG46554.1 integrase [Mesorhizobium sp. DCY119]
MSEPKLTKRPGSDNWYIRGTNSAGRPVFRSTKTKDEATAKALLVQYQARVLVEKVHGPVATTTFDEAARAYIKDGGDQTYLLRQDREGRRHGLMPHFGDAKLASITQDDLDKAATALCRPGASRETLIRNVYTPFIAVWNFASSEVRKMAAPKKWQRPRKAKGTNVLRIAGTKRSGTRPVDYNRAAQFVANMSPAPAMVMTALFFTGLRPIELFALESSEVNVAGRWLVLHSTKTGEPRGVPIHEFLAPLFESLLKRGDLENDPRIFRTHKGEAYRPTEDGGGQLKTAIIGARRRSGILDISPYTARHSVSTGLVIAGVHPHIKDQILGHAADNMSRHYTNVPQAPLIEAINKLPVPDAWQALPWWQDPLAWSAKLVEGTGARNDLKEKRA